MKSGGNDTCKETHVVSKKRTGQIFSTRQAAKEYHDQLKLCGRDSKIVKNGDKYTVYVIKKPEENI
jgi:fatty acid-binding protein DegV